MGIPSPRASGFAVPSLLSLLLLTLSASSLVGQGGFQWPERSENLQALPEDFPADRLRAVMTGFTRALGVRCSHCHVGEEGQPLSEYDFASDANANKVRARVMLEMLGSINDYLDQIEPSGPERVNMWCTTCHAGRPRPQTLAEALDEARAAGGEEGATSAALVRFAELRDRYFAAGAYDFTAAGVARVAAGWAEEGALEAAVALAERNLSDWPEASAAHQGMAQVLLAAGDRDGAVRHLEHAVALDPENPRLRRMLEQVRSGG
jgi:tetratricopeptide (TPR) repeat protein